MPWSIVHGQEKMSKKLIMLIGELSKRTGFSRDTIRFYEKIGLIRMGRKDRRENNYKEYSTAILDRLLTIKACKAYGFSLVEIGELLDFMEADLVTCGRMDEKVTQKIDLINQKIKTLEQMKEKLLKGMEACTNSKGQLNKPKQRCPMFT